MLSSVVPLLLCLLCISELVLARSDVINRSNPLVERAVIEPNYFTENVIGCTNGAGGAFSFLWGNVENVARPVCGKGWKTGTDRTINYQGTYWPAGESKFYIYGWTRNPLVEYYVMDSFGVYTQYPNVQVVGTTTCNGVLYDVLQGWRYNQTSIDGTQTFQQFWSARKGILRGPISGSIDMSCHFKAWESFGMKLGTAFDYQIAAVDELFCNGNAKMTISSS